MCVGCPDFVDSCSEGSCNRTQPGGRYKHTTFYLGDTFCEHLTDHHGTSNASAYAHIRRSHLWETEYDKDPLLCEDNCLEWKVWTEDDIMRVVEKLRENEE
jgi:hypothetical protein